jgi:hypothetical protein
VSGKRVMAENLVSSSLSNAVFLENEGIRSAYGKFCAPIEAKRCQWSGAATHPDDLRTCALLGLSVHFQYLSDESRRLQPLWPTNGCSPPGIRLPLQRNCGISRDRAKY